MLILGVGFVWWHVPYTTKVALKEPTGFVSPLMWLWFRDRPKLKSVQQQRDTALASAGISDGPAQGMHARMRRAADLARVVRSGPSSGGALSGGRPRGTSARLSRSLQLCWSAGSPRLAP
jgi:hypothetical protein